MYATWMYGCVDVWLLECVSVRGCLCLYEYVRTFVLVCLVSCFVVVCKVFCTIVYVCVYVLVYMWLFV